MHTNFKKFLAIAATASIVTIAAVPTVEAAHFSDTKNTKYDVPAKTMIDRHIMTSFSDGTFRPAQKLTRKHLILLTGKYLESEYYDVPIDYLATKRFEDLLIPDKGEDELFEYSMIVRDLDVVTDTYLKANQALTKEDMALALVRAYAVVHDFDVINYVATQNFKRTITDTKTAKNQTQAAIDVLDYYGIVKNKYFPKGVASRGEFAYILHSLMQIKPPADDIKAVGVVDSKTIRVVLHDYSTKTVKLNTTLKTNTPTTVSFKLNGKTYKSNVTYKKQKDVLKTIAVSDSKAKIILTDGTVYDYSSNHAFWKNSKIQYNENFGGKNYTFQIRVNEPKLMVYAVYTQHLSQFRIEFNQPIKLPDTLTAKQLEKYVRVTDLKTNKPVELSHAKMYYTNDTLIVTTNGVPIQSKYKIEVSNVQSVRYVKQEKTYVQTSDFSHNQDRTAPDHGFPRTEKSLLTISFYEPVRPITSKNATFKTEKGATITNVKILAQTKANEDIVFDFKNAKINGKAFKGGQAITVKLNGILDIAGNKLESKPDAYNTVLFNKF